MRWGRGERRAHETNGCSSDRVVCGLRRWGWGYWRRWRHCVGWLIGGRWRRWRGPLRPERCGGGGRKRRHAGGPGREPDLTRWTGQRRSRRRNPPGHRGCAAGRGGRRGCTSHLRAGGYRVRCDCCGLLCRERLCQFPRAGRFILHSRLRLRGRVQKRLLRSVEERRLGLCACIVLRDMQESR